MRHLVYLVLLQPALVACLQLGALAAEDSPEQIFDRWLANPPAAAAQGTAGAADDAPVRPAQPLALPEEPAEAIAPPPIAPPIAPRAALPPGPPGTLNAPNVPVLANSYPELEKRVKNFVLVTPGLLRGGQPLAADLKLLHEAGVKTIINLRTEEVLVRQEESLARSLGMRFVNIPLDVFNPPSEAAIATFFKVIDESANQPVYIHCLHGQDRTGTMVALYRIERQNWTAERAYQEMLALGFRPGLSRLTQVVFVRSGQPAPSASRMIEDWKSRRQRLLSGQH